MTPELTALALAALLQAVQFCLYAVFGNHQAGIKAGLGPRDTKVELTGTAGRIQRAMSNHYEALTLFTIAVLVVTLADQSSTTTRACAYIYLVARVLYIPAYVIGVAPWRSAIWAVGFFATVTMLLAALV